MEVLYKKMSCINVTGSIKIANKYYICLQVLLKRNEVLYFPNEVLYFPNEVLYLDMEVLY